MAKRKMLAYDPERAAMLDEKITRWGYPTEKKKMFGHEVHFLNGYMFSGANVDGVFVHLGEKTVQSALAKTKGVSAFHPLEGMTMKDYLLIDAKAAEQPRTLKHWMDISAEYLESLPPKMKKTSKTKSPALKSPKK